MSFVATTTNRHHTVQMLFFLSASDKPLFLVPHILCGELYFVLHALGGTPLQAIVLDPWEALF